MLNRIIDGQGTLADIERLEGVANKIEGHTICALGDAAAWPVQSFLKHFGHEFVSLTNGYVYSCINAVLNVSIDIFS
jgi:NADH:ubiquinone oxidoreductase subunit F (NADH-binding)